MELQVIKACAVSGRRLEEGARLVIGEDISQDEAGVLINMRRAVPAKPKPTRKKASQSKTETTEAISD